MVEGHHGQMATFRQQGVGVAKNLEAAGGGCGW